MVKGTLLLGIFLLIISMTYSQSNNFGFNQLTEKQKEYKAPFCLPNNEYTKSVLLQYGIPLKYETSQWIYFTSDATFISKLAEEGVLANYYLEYNPPHLMNDSARARHAVDAVHMGTGLASPYTGKDVIIGYVDTGIELEHPDFKDANGKTRVLRYWDHSTNTGGTPSPYGYGIVWDSTQINAGLCTSNDGSAHGTTVAGAGSGNGLSVGYNHGMAPESDIIMVESNFNLPNWSLTIADACDYIFKVADTLGKPAIVNLSLGSYLGSHDGNDPAAELIESLLDEKAGRIVVSACGNSGNIGKYHCGADLDSDTSFVWFINNPGGALGANTIFFDLYSDMPDATFNYAIKAVNPGNNYETRGTTIFRSATASMINPIYDTIWNGSNRIATIELYFEQEGDNFHMQGYLSHVDSTTYNYGFYTTGSGHFDLWSGQAIGYNNMVTAIPNVAVFPSIIHYNAPDSLQTIVSNWNCSEKVVSVGNVKNRASFANYAGGFYFPSDVIPPGKLSINSSKGPNRHNVLKPNIAASGDVILSPGPIWYLNNPANYPKMDTGGWHMGNGGTSMSCPVVAGIAALYLEQCKGANYQHFLDAIAETAFANSYTGTLPNYAYGAGLIHAHDLLLNNTFATIDPITQVSIYELTTNSSTNYQWTLNGEDLDGETNATLFIGNPDGTFTCYATSETGCRTETNPVTLFLSLDQIDKEDVIVYPNPTSGLIQFDMQQNIESVRLVNALGEEVLFQNSELNSINLSELTAGWYVLEISANGKKYQTKVVKK